MQDEKKRFRRVALIIFIIGFCVLFLIRSVSAVGIHEFQNGSHQEVGATTAKKFWVSQKMYDTGELSTYSAKQYYSDDYSNIVMKIYYCDQNKDPDWDQLLGTSNLVNTTKSISLWYNFVFETPVLLESGSCYSFVVVRQDNSSLDLDWLQDQSWKAYDTRSSYEDDIGQTDLSGTYNFYYNLDANANIVEILDDPTRNMFYGFILFFITFFGMFYMFNKFRRKGGD